MAISEFTITGHINLKDDEILTIKTKAGHDLYVMFGGGRLTICNESKLDRGGRELAVFYDDGSIGLEEG